MIVTRGRRRTAPHREILFDAARCLLDGAASSCRRDDARRRANGASLAPHTLVVEELGRRVAMTGRVVQPIPTAWPVALRRPVFQFRFIV